MNITMGPAFWFPWLKWSNTYIFVIRTCMGWVGLGGTMADRCITALSKKCSLASNFHAQQQGLALQQSYSSEQISLPPQDAINICWQNNTESISKVILPRTQQQIQLPPLLWKAPRSLEALASTVSLLFSGGRHQPSSLYSDIIFHVDRQVKNLCQSCGQYR